MKLSRPIKRSRPENTIALINVVFLLLIFFLVAGTLTAPADEEVDLVRLSSEGAATPPDMLFVRADGSLTWQGTGALAETIVAEWKAATLGADRPLRIAVDRELPAANLVETIAVLRKAGAGRMVLITERHVK